MKKVMNRLIVRGLLGVILFSTVAITVAGQNDESQKVVGQFVVGPSATLMPQGMFLLIRKGRKIGSIRFTNIEEGGKPGTGKASYESYFQSDGSGSFRSRHVRKKTGEIDVKPLKGFHPLAFQTGRTKVKVGDWSFESDAPGSLYMWPYGRSEKDYGYEFAPTSSQSVDEIDASDKRLRWFRYSADTKVVLRVSELPK
jgi:hypothetical protein